MKTLFAFLMVLLALGAPAGAFEISFRDTSQEANFVVSVYDLELDKDIVVSNPERNLWTLSIDNKGFFSEHAYRTIYVNFTWRPPEGSSTYVDTREMSLEFEVLLRAWSADDISMRSNYFLGIGERNVIAYEAQWRAGTQFERLVGSLLLRQHFEIVLRDPQYRHAIRSTKVALSAARQLSRAREWFLPPSALTSYVETSLLADNESLALLNLMAAEPLKDLLEVENILSKSTMTCRQWEHFFEYLSGVAASFPSARDLLYKQSASSGDFASIFAEKRKIVFEEVDCS